MLSSFIASFILYVFTIGLFSYCCWQDIKFRKCSNQIVLAIILSGIVFSYIQGRIGFAFISFILLNILGIILYTLHLWGPADGKLFSCLAFFIPIERLSCLIMVFVVFAVVLTIGYIFLIKPEKRWETLKLEKTNLWWCWINKSRHKLFHTVDDVYKQKTVPFAIFILPTFIISVLLSWVV